MVNEKRPAWVEAYDDLPDRPEAKVASIAMVTAQLAVVQQTLATIELAPGGNDTKFLDARALLDDLGKEAGTFLLDVTGVAEEARELLRNEQEILEKTGEAYSPPEEAVNGGHIPPYEGDDLPFYEGDDIFGHEV